MALCSVCETEYTLVRSSETCSRTCAERARYRRTVGKPVSDREFGYKPRRQYRKGGGPRVDVNGYVRVRGGGKPERYEHRIVMEEVIGRPLRKSDSVHHKNGDKTDNRPENLELWIGYGAQPKGQRATDRLQAAIRLLEDHGYLVLPPSVRGRLEPHSDQGRLHLE